ncbi:hypothetical protein EV128_105142 [Rhizobium azibense]|nr:hypothetical protein EV128_105142 [Rhizobium azibense]
MMPVSPAPNTLKISSRSPVAENAVTAMSIGRARDERHFIGS